MTSVTGAVTRAQRGPRVTVVGDGIVGVSAARQLARRGAQVTLLGRGPGSGGASWRSFGWLGAAQDMPEDYHRLRLAGMSRYRALLEDLDAPGVIRFSGSLAWEIEDAPIQPLQGTTDRESIPATFARLRRLGHPVDLIDRARAAALDPALRPDALSDEVLWARDEGWVDLASLTGLLLADALAAGARHVQDPGGAAITDDRGRAGVRTSDGTRIPADAVLVAAGARTPELLAATGVVLPAGTTWGALVITAPHTVQPRLLARTAAGNVRPHPGGGLAIHSTDLDIASAAGAGPGGDAADAVRRLLRQVGALYRTDVPLEVDRVAAGPRPIPGDGWPVVGEVGGLSGMYVAFTHSGATLGPLLGELVATEILEPGHRSPLLAPYRAQRFAVWSALGRGTRATHPEVADGVAGHGDEGMSLAGEVGAGHEPHRDLDRGIHAADLDPQQVGGPGERAGDERETDAPLHHRQECAPVRGLGDDRDVRLLEALVEDLAHVGARGARDERQTREVGDRERTVTAEGEAGRDGDGVLLEVEELGAGAGEVRPVLTAEYRDVAVAARDRVGGLFDGVDAEADHPERRVRPHDRGDDRGHRLDRGRLRDRDAHLSRNLVRSDAGDRLERLEVGDDRPRPGHEGFADVGDHDPGPTPTEQLGAHLELEPAHRPGQRGLGDVERFGRLAEAPVLGDRHEIFEESTIHA
jgi:glycine/D-amino acid oxidase-like deaminating enzyme